MCVGERPAFLWVCGIIPLMAPEGFWKVEEAGGGRWGRVSQESTASDPPLPPWPLPSCPALSNLPLSSGIY